jgi:hypothetical protein
VVAQIRQAVNRARGEDHDPDQRGLTGPGLRLGKSPPARADQGRDANDPKTRRRPAEAFRREIADLLAEARKAALALG